MYSVKKCVPRREGTLGERGCVIKRDCVFVCVCEREREREGERERERERGKAGVESY